MISLTYTFFRLGSSQALPPPLFNKVSQPVSITHVLETVEVTEHNEILRGVAPRDTSVRDPWEMDFAGTTPALGVDITDFSLFNDNQ